MNARPVLGAAFALVVANLAAFACSDYTPPDVPSYGPPNALGVKSPAQPSASGDSGSQPAGGDSGGGSSASVLCVTAGGTLVAAGTCAVSWKTDIYPKMQAGGAWGCAGAAPCHSTTAPVLTGDEHTVWLAMANFADPRNNNVPYINPCSTSTDATKTSFVCDTLPTGSCGDAMPLGTGLTNGADIATWVTCGSPEN
jgi:hypothetical protein